MEQDAAGAPGPLSRLRVRADEASVRLLLGLAQAETGAVDEAFVTLAGPLPPPDPGECRITFGHTEGTLFSLASAGGATRFARREVPERGLVAALQAGGAELDAVLGPVLDEARCPSETKRLVLVDGPGTLSGRLASRIRRQLPGVQTSVAYRADRPWPGTIRGRKALSIFGPKLESSDARSVLAGASREAEALAQAFLESATLTGLEATPARVADRAAEFDVLHFGVHGVSRTGFGGASYLQLAGSPGRLQVADVLDLDLADRRPLVLLSACDTAGAVESLEYDGAGLPWAFLEAGASAVIAAEGALDDAVASSFTRGLAAALAHGAAVPEAFRAGIAAVAREHSSGAGEAFALYF